MTYNGCDYVQVLSFMLCLCFLGLKTDFCVVFCVFDHMDYGHN